MTGLLVPVLLILHCQRVAAIVCYECTRSSPMTPQHLCPSQYNEQQNISALPKTTCTRTSYCAEVSYQTKTGKSFDGKNCLGENGLAYHLADNPVPGCEVSDLGHVRYVYCICNTDLCNNRTLTELLTAGSSHNTSYPVLPFLTAVAIFSKLLGP